ncbi:GntR family transcriptional regulator [Streptomyces sp. NPDC023723]|uniref:GntR family transcriptional regulator n=1 Tax=Streptomyces sp. NPDC023723 TaxID=3154323 RepID=UPI0033EE3ED6
MGEARAGDGGGREFQRVLAALRERILDGTYGFGRVLPPQRELAARLGVSRDTVQRVLAELREEGWLETRQGSGSRVIREGAPAPVPALPMAEADLGWFIGRVFAARTAALDVYTLTTESLDAHVREQAERIVHGRSPAPEEITLRILLPSEEQEHPYPRSTRDPDDRRMRDRLRRISDRHLGSLRMTLAELAANSLVARASVVVRRVPLTPAFKVYLLNRTELLHSVYQVIPRRIMLTETDQVDALDVLGLGARATHFAKSPFVDAHQQWFDSLWEHLSVPESKT